MFSVRTHLLVKSSLTLFLEVVLRSLESGGAVGVASEGVGGIDSIKPFIDVLLLVSFVSFYNSC